MGFVVMASSEGTDDDNLHSSSSEDDLPPPPQTGSRLCWCKRCMGTQILPVYKTYDHILTYGQHDNVLPGGASSGQVSCSTHTY